MTKVRFLGEADLELSKAVDYYEEIHSGLGLDFEREVKENVFKIAENPEIWALRALGITNVPFGMETSHQIQGERNEHIGICEQRATQ
jgi:hypothetical protein